jgi:hypothetical protein
MEIICTFPAQSQDIVHTTQTILEGFRKNLKKLGFFE